MPPLQLHHHLMAVDGYRQPVWWRSLQLGRVPGAPRTRGTRHTQLPRLLIAHFRTAHHRHHCLHSACAGGLAAGRGGVGEVAADAAPRRRAAATRTLLGQGVALHPQRVCVVEAEE